MQNYLYYYIIYIGILTGSYILFSIDDSDKKGGAINSDNNDEKKLKIRMAY